MSISRESKVWRNLAATA